LRGHEEGNGARRQDEPDDHALGRYRGGLTTKIHRSCDGRGRPLAVLLTAGQRNEGICTRPAPRANPGAPPRSRSTPLPTRPRSRGQGLCLPRSPCLPAQARHRTHHPGKRDQQRHRRNRGRDGGRPPQFDRDIYRRRHIVERRFNRLKGLRGTATRYDKTASSYEAAGGRRAPRQVRTCRGGSCRRPPPELPETVLT
jgi:transposase